MMGEQTPGEEGQRNGKTPAEQAEVVEETGSSLGKGCMAAAAAMATVGVVVRAGQLS